MMLTAAVSIAMRLHLTELTLDHVLVQRQRLAIFCVGARGRVDNLAILVQHAVRGDGALCLGRLQELERICELAVQRSRKQNPINVSTHFHLPALQ
jgi:hypothetical protein